MIESRIVGLSLVESSLFTFQSSSSVLEFEPRIHSEAIRAINDDLIKMTVNFDDMFGCKSGDLVLMIANDAVYMLPQTFRVVFDHFISPQEKPEMNDSRFLFQTRPRHFYNTLKSRSSNSCSNLHTNTV